jgi:mannose-6-phosphate isomerase-like protein (cupin superfamily)
MNSDSIDPRPFVIQAEDVRPFSLPGDDITYASRAVIAPQGANSKDLLVNHFTLKPKRGMAGHIHPDNDELYYILSGEGFVELGGSGGPFEKSEHPVSRDTAVFIPAGTFHLVRNESDSELVLLTIWPRLPTAGANPIFDGRIASWGTSFQLCSDENEKVRG